MKKNIIKKTGIAALLMALTVVSSSNASFAAEVNTDNFVRTSFDLNGKASELEEEIITDVYDKWDITDMTDSGKVNSMTRAAGDLYQWTLRPLDTYEIIDVYRKKGSTITVSCGLNGDSGKYIVAGIIEPDCTARAVKAKDAVAHTFAINESGYYSVFARNINSTNIKVDLIYYL